MRHGPSCRAVRRSSPQSTGDNMTKFSDTQRQAIIAKGRANAARTDDEWIRQDDVVRRPDIPADTFDEPQDKMAAAIALDDAAKASFAQFQWKTERAAAMGLVYKTCEQPRRSDAAVEWAEIDRRIAAVRKELAEITERTSATRPLFSPNF